MNTLEALFSFLVLVSLIPLFMYITIDSSHIDYSHYKLKLAEDVWRILYLKQDLENFNKLEIQKDLDKITELTSLCILIEEEDTASCIPSESSVVVKKVAFINGNPEIVTLVIGVE